MRDKNLYNPRPANHPAFLGQADPQAHGERRDLIQPGNPLLVQGFGQLAPAPSRLSCSYHFFGELFGVQPKKRLAASLIEVVGV